MTLLLLLLLLLLIIIITIIIINYLRNFLNRNSKNLGAEESKRAGFSPWDPRRYVDAGVQEAGNEEVEDEV